MRRSALSVVLALLTVTAAIASWADTNLPTWPQSFQMTPGGRVGFSFPVTQPGEIAVTVTWNGVPLAVELDSPAKMVAGSTQPANSPVNLSYIAADTDLQQGVVWTVIVAAPGKPIPLKSKPAPVATGQITVRCPPIDTAKLGAFLSTAGTQRAALNRSGPDKLKSMLSGDNSNKPSTKVTGKPMPNLDDWIRAQQQDESKRFADLRAKIVASIPAVTPAQTIRPTKADLRPGPRPNTQVTLPSNASGISPPEKPKLKFLGNSPTYDEGYPGDKVNLASPDNTDNPALYEVYFTLKPGTNVKAEMLSAGPINGKDLMFTAVVPEEIPGMNVDASHQARVPVFIRRYSDDRRLFTDSDPVTYDFHAFTIPRVDGIQPSSRVHDGEKVKIVGEHLCNSKAHILFPDGRHEVRPFDCNLPQLVIPSYTATVDFPVVLYMEQEQHGRTFRSNLFDLTALRDSPAIYRVSTSEVKLRGPVYIHTNEELAFTGIGGCIALWGDELQRLSTLHFEPNPGQEARIFTRLGDPGDLRKDWSRASASSGRSDYAVYEVLPIYGVSASVSGNLMATYDGGLPLPPPIPFTLTPHRLSQRIFDPVYLPSTAFARGDGNDQYSQVNVTPEVGNQWPMRSWAGGWHQSGLVAGHAGDDVFVMDAPLKNGWTLESVIFKATHENEKSLGARLVGFWQDEAGRPVIQVRWWVDAPNRDIWYSITPVINGPWGVPYK